MRVLGIETSTVRGSVALVENGQLVARQEHTEANAHAERLLPLIDAAMKAAGWEASGLQRIGVGLGPGSFTGVRVGLALAQGLALGLQIPLVGVCSLRAMAAAVPPGLPGLRVACLDARRGEVFVGAYEDATASTAPAPLVVPRGELDKLLNRLSNTAPLVVTGEVAFEPGDATLTAPTTPWLAPSPRTVPYRAPDADLPDARWTATLATTATLPLLPLEPLYLRDADAVLPSEPPDRLLSALTKTEDGS